MQRICIYCGANAGADPDFATAARSFARLLADHRIGIVYGGASVGLMGVVADAALEAGGEVVGVIPQALMDKELAHDGLTQLEVVASMHERKARMAELADAFIALPGGLGTLEELFEILTWGQLGFHRKPCGVLNVNGYYDKLLAFLDHAVDSSLLRPAFRAMLRSASAPEALLSELTRYTAPAVPRWVDASET